ncbi:hypothetical protein [Moorena bouillonii]|uniref:hypothetical protein n=1 Tax=Moorena bouillonii TaxID=207920 RepID=UPI0013018AD0|nr:hypothetical protein [Moorena bouillonii]
MSTIFSHASSDAEVRPVANLIRQRKAHLSGLGGFPHERLHQEMVCSLIGAIAL